MAYVITAACTGVKDTSCVDVCPVDCIHGTDDDPRLSIAPDECIDSLGAGRVEALGQSGMVAGAADLGDALAVELARLEAALAAPARPGVND
jgi:Na+-translocating ferredoxin:NAD+ oxidoreductase RNF subunit RnfB